MIPNPKVNKQFKPGPSGHWANQVKPVTMIKFLKTISELAICHAVAAFVVLGGSLAFAVVGYLGLPFWAVLAGQAFTPFHHREHRAA